MTAFALILALLGHHTHHTAERLGAAIDAVCDGDRDCVLDAVATCYVETRCQMGLCGSNGCGPFQQLARYADHDALAAMTITDRRAALENNATIAAEQWLIKRNKYRQRWGDRWPWRYNGSDNAERYFNHWTRVRARMEKTQ